MRVKLGALCTFSNGGTPSRMHPRYFEGDIPWITGADIVDSKVGNARSHITAEAIEKSATNLVPKGTVLLVTRTSVGKVAVAGTSLCFSQDITALRPNSRRINTGYLVHFLKTQEPYFARIARGATIKGITRERIAELSIPLPPVAEQKRIAGFLGAAEMLRAKRRTTLALLDSLASAVFREMFGEGATKASTWPSSTLGSLTVAGPQNGMYRPSSDYGRGVPILRIDGFYDGAVVDIASLKRVGISPIERKPFELAEGDIVINRVNSIEYLGKCALIPKLPEPTVFESNMMRLRVDTSVIHPRFLVQVLQTPELRSQILGRAKRAVNQASINQQDVGSFRIPLPPLPLQREFVAKVTAIEGLSSTARRSSDALDSLFASLQHRAFNGDI